MDSGYQNRPDSTPKRSKWPYDEPFVSKKVFSKKKNKKSFFDPVNPAETGNIFEIDRTYIGHILEMIIIYSINSSFGVMLSLFVIFGSSMHFEMTGARFLAIIPFPDLFDRNFGCIV